MAPIRLIGFVVIVAAMMAGSLWLAQHGGGVSVSGFGYTLTAPAGIAVGLLLALLVFTFAFGQLWAWLHGLPKRLKRWRQAKREKEGFQATATALQALAASQGKVAQGAVKKLKDIPEAQPVAQLMEALVYSRFGDINSAQARLQLLTEQKETAPFAHRVLLAQARRQADWQAVARHSGEVLKNQTDDKQALADRLQALQHTHDYAKTLTLLPKASKNGVMPPEQQPWLIAFNALQAAHAETEAKKRLELLKQATTALPDFTPAWEVRWRDQNMAKLSEDLEKSFLKTERLELFKLWLRCQTQQRIAADKLVKKAQKLLKSVKYQPLAQHALALVYEKTQDKTRAREILAELVTNNLNRQSLEMLARLEGQSFGAENWHQQARDAAPLQPDAAWVEPYRQWQRTYLAGVSEQKLQEPSDALLLGHA